MDFGRRGDTEQHWLMWFVPVETLTEAQNLALRFKEGRAFPQYVRNRLRLVIPIGLLAVLISVSCSAAFVVYVAGLNSWLALPAIIMMPAILIGSLFVQAYVLFSWIETRAVSRTAGQHARKPQGPFAAWLAKKFGAHLGKLPPIPWVMTTLFVIAPLAMLASFSPMAALVLVLLAILAPNLFSILDQ